MLRWARLSRSSPRGDAGITLTELVVSMSLMSIVGALALTAFVATGDGTTRTTESSQTVATARTTMSSWTGLLQVAVVPDPSRPAARNLAVTASSISFNAQLGNLPSCTTVCATDNPTAVTLSLRTTSGRRAQLVQTLTRDGSATTLVLVPDGAAAEGDCLFHPFTYDGTDLGCSPLAAGESARVGRIDVAFAVTPAAGPARHFESSVKLPGATA